MFGHNCHYYVYTKEIYKYRGISKVKVKYEFLVVSTIMTWPIPRYGLDKDRGLN